MLCPLGAMSVCGCVFVRASMWQVDEIAAIMRSDRSIRCIPLPHAAVMQRVDILQQNSFILLLCTYLSGAFPFPGLTRYSLSFHAFVFQIREDFGGVERWNL